MNRNTVYIGILISIGFAISLFLYQQQGAAKRLASKYKTNINLNYYQMRALVHQPQQIKAANLAEYKANINTSISNWDQNFQKTPQRTLAGYLQLLEYDPGNVRIHLRIGMLALKLDQYELAKTHLYFVYKHKEAGIQPDAAWFMGLLALEEGNLLDAKQKLQESIDMKSNYSRHATKLIALIKA